MNRRGFTLLNLSKRNFGGFTIIELIIVITIMGILLILGVVNLDDSQMNARDAERKADVETIATHLETYYTSGTDNSTEVGSYPSTSVIGTMADQQTALRDIDIKNLIAPDAPDKTITSLVVATNGLQTTADVSPQPESAANQYQYVYQPLTQTGAICDADAITAGLTCQKFNLYYKTEVDSTVVMITSKNQ